MPLRRKPASGSTIPIEKALLVKRWPFRSLYRAQVTHGLKGCTATSRHQRTNWIVINEGAERRQLSAGAIRGRAAVYNKTVH